MPCSSRKCVNSTPKSNLFPAKQSSHVPCSKGRQEEKKFLKYVTQGKCPMNLSRLKVTIETTLHSPEELENLKLAVRKN